MGHENEQITEVNYAKITGARCDEIFSKLSKGDRETVDEKDLLLNLYEYNLIPGTPEFDRAKKLQMKRLKR